MNSGNLSGRLVKRVLGKGLAILGAVAALATVASSAMARTIPSPHPPVLSLNIVIPTALQYHDNDGDGEITIRRSGYDQYTGGQAIAVEIHQNGAVAQGHGVLEGLDPYTNLILFNVRVGRTTYFFRGVVDSMLHGIGSYEVSGSGRDESEWWTD